MAGAFRLAGVTLALVPVAARAFLISIGDQRLFLAVSAFPGHPLVYFAIILGPIVELPVLLLISRVLLAFRSRLWKAQPVDYGTPLSPEDAVPSN